jgi:Zn-dependent M28 family amino/carboxypeptidase
MDKLILVTGFALVMSACGNSTPDVVVSTDDALATITQAGIYAHLEYLASDELEGRMTGAAGYDLAAKYVAGQFAALGLEPGGTEGWNQPVPLQSYVLDEQHTSVTLHRASGDVALHIRDDFLTRGDKVRPETSVRGELVYVGFGIHAPDFGYSDFDGVDLEGKIAVFISGGPDIIPSEELAHYSAGLSKYKELARRGAIGTIMAFSRYDEENIPWDMLLNILNQPGMAWIDAAGNASNYFPQLRGFALFTSGAAAALFEGSPLSFDDARDLTEASTPGSVALGIEATLAGKTEQARLSSPNVIGILRGTDAALADEYVVYTAHLDHVGRGDAVDGDDIYNGMYDNAMGVALMLETARALAAAPPRRSVMFIALTGEEEGLLGSDYFAHYPTVSRDALVANVNMDMPVLVYPIAELVAFGAEHSSLQAVARAAAVAEGFVLAPDPMPEEHYFVRSDQYSFVQQGVPAICLDPGFKAAVDGVDGEAIRTEFQHKHYHKPSDDLTLPVDWPSAIRLARANARIGWGIANDAARPSWNDGDFFGALYAP